MTRYDIVVLEPATTAPWQPAALPKVWTLQSNAGCPSRFRGGVTVHNACHARAQNMGIKSRDMLKLIPNVKLDVVERCAGHGGTFGVMKDTHDLANKVGRPTARQIKNKNNKYMASDCPLAGKHLKQLEADTNISNDEALHPIELMAKSYRL